MIDGMNVIAVVVTYNRKDLLIECLEGILGQTYSVNKLVIVNNNSTDDTEHLLKSKGILDNPKIIYKKLRENIGGAGGFHEGMKEAFMNKADWIWVMDDDTIPLSDCLEKMVGALDILENKVSFLASQVKGIKDEPMNVPMVDTSQSENGYADWYRFLDKGIVKISLATFVSLLINGKAVEKVGLPCKDYFIWGDDTEYTMRLTTYYDKAYFIGNSKVLHKRIGGNALSILEEDNKFRIKMYYYMYRNTLINTNAYKGKMSLLIQLYSIIRLIPLILLRGKNKMLKIRIILRAVFAFIFRRYDYEGFKNRMNFTK